MATAVAEEKVRSPDHEQELDRTIKEIERKNRELEKRKQIVADEAKANGIPKAIITRAEGISSKSTAGRGRRSAPQWNREWDVGKLPVDEWKKRVPDVENNKSNGELPKSRNAVRNGPPLPSGGRGRPPPPPRSDSNNDDPPLRGAPRPPRDSLSGGVEGGGGGGGERPTEPRPRLPPPRRNPAFFHDDRSNPAPASRGDPSTERTRPPPISQPRSSRLRRRSPLSKHVADDNAVDRRGQYGGHGQSGGSGQGSGHGQGGGGRDQGGGSDRGGGRDQGGGRGQGGGGGHGRGGGARSQSGERQPQGGSSHRRTFEEKLRRRYIRRMIKRQIRERQERRERNKELGIVPPVAQPLGPGKETTRKEYQIISKVLFKLVRRVCYQMGEYKPKGTAADGKPYFETKRRDVGAGLQSAKDDEEREEEVMNKLDTLSVAENGAEKATTDKSESTDEPKPTQSEEKEGKEEAKAPAMVEKPKEEAKVVDEPTESEKTDDVVSVEKESAV